MNKIVINHLTVYGLLHAFFLKYTDKLILNIMIAALFARIDHTSIEIKLLGSQQGGDNTGIAEEKTDAKVILVNSILQNSGPAYTCYLEAGKKTEANKLKFSYSYLEDMSAEVLVGTANAVITDCTTNIEFLESSGVTVDTLAKINDAIGLFSTDILLPLLKIKSKKDITTLLNSKDKENWGLVNKQLKPAMKIYINSDKIMYNEFLGMCRAPKVGVRKPTGPRAAKYLVAATVLDSISLEPILGAVIKYVGVRGNVKTDINGVANKEMPEGPHMGKITAEGYDNQSFIFTLTELGYAVTIKMIPKVV